MGSSYTSVTLVGTKLDQVREVAIGPAYLAESDGVVVVFSEADDSGNLSGPSLSGALGCVALTTTVFDDDVLMISVHTRGEPVGELGIPDPMAMFGDVDLGGGEAPFEDGTALDAAALVAAVGRGDVAQVQTAFAKEYVFASERHQDVVAALGLPSAAVAWGYRYLTEDREHYTGPALIAVGGAPD